MSPAVAFALWGFFLAALCAIGAAVWGFADPAPPALLGGGAVLMWTLAAVIALRRLGVPRLGSPAAAPDLSPATVWLGASITLLALSTELGFWLALIAAGMVAVGVAAVARELLAQRRALRRAEATHGAAATVRAEE